VFAPLPAYAAAGGAGARPSDAVITLGRALYFDPRLSVNDTISCNSCHDLARHGVDGEPTSPGHAGERGGRNSPTTLNAALHVAQFWDGRAADVEEQAKGPVLNPVEMGMPDAAAVEAKLRGITGYPELFAAAFPGQAEPVTFDNAAVAIAAFERGLVTPSVFDRWLEGDPTALTDAQSDGLAAFMDTGCTTCHNGPGVGGSGFFKLGLVNPYETTDVGRFQVTHAEADRQVFKVPSLRNVTRTAPYFHDGSVATLDDAVGKMAHHQLGKDLSDADVARLIAFLGALEGTVPPDVATPPALPGR
jgi:cytochrome c peroxidase